MDQKQYESAMAEFKKADGLYPGSRPKYQIAFCLDKMARYDEALAAYQTFIDSRPSNKYAAEIAGANKRITEITEQLGPPAVAVAESGGTVPPPVEEPELPPVKPATRPVRRELLAKHADIDKMEQRQVKKYLEEAGFTNVRPEDGQYFFEYSGMKGALAIRSRTFFQFSVDRKNGEPLVWMGLEPKQLVNREFYRAEDLPEIAKLIKEHFEEYKFGITKALVVRGVKQYKVKDAEMGTGILAPDGAYYFKYKGAETCVITLDHGPTKIIRFTRMRDNQPESYVTSGNNFDQAIGKMIDQLNEAA
ncbi:MAG: hypothetical protein ABIG80_05270 [Patescibacteria group bacterium]